MKKIFALITLITTLSTAQAFYINAECSFNQAVGQCAVFNASYAPIFCQLAAEGALATGQYVYGNVVSQIAPGQYAYVTVNAVAPYLNPLTYVVGFAECQ